MTTVYRVETPEGFGPYSKIAPRLESASSHRSPRSEGLDFPYNYHFGFSELNAVTLWFSGKEIEALGKYGERWLLSRYEVPPEHMVESSTQVAFNRKRAELTGCIPLDTLAGNGRERLSEGRALELSSGFMPHRECTPHTQHSSFKGGACFKFSWEGERTVDREKLELRLQHLREGSYYAVQKDPNERSRFVLYRDGALYPLRESEFSPFPIRSVVRPEMSISAFGH